MKKRRFRCWFRLWRADWENKTNDKTVKPKNKIVIKCNFIELYSQTGGSRMIAAAPGSFSMYKISENLLQAALHRVPVKTEQNNFQKFSESVIVHALQGF